MSTIKDRKTGYFHALGKAIRYENEPLAGTVIKSSHNISTSEIWAPETNLPYVDVSNIIEFSGRTDVTFYERKAVKMVPGSNGESYYIEDNGSFVKSWIAPTDLPDPILGTPSSIIDVKVYDRFGVLVNSSNGYYSVDFYAGLLKFEYGNTPDVIISDSPPFTETIMSNKEEDGTDTLFIDVYVYTGSKLDSFVAGTPIDSLSGLTDVTIVNPLNNQTLIYSGGTWKNAQTDPSGNIIDLSPYQTSAQTNVSDLRYSTTAHTHILDDLSGVSVSDAHNNDILSYNDGVWNASELFFSGITDVVITNPLNNQTLIYSGGTWKNAQTDPSGNIIDLSPYQTSAQT